ncbi:MAG: MetQ/NlpA family ABC transporter substrate-binding protein [Oscillospiraceae bacterium]|nr:metal ABC transporter substrate-binding protein [Oscillospiraceae bacterium]
MNIKKIAALILTLALVFSLAACGSKTPSTETDIPATGEPENENVENVTLKVAATPVPHAEILAVAKEILAEQGITLEIIEFTDYVQPCMVTENGEVDANYFAHLPYIDGFNAENGTHLVSVAAIHYEPLGLYAGKTASIEELADGAKIAVPNDGSNEARALLLLEANGLITLKEGAGFTATKLDIVENPKNLEIVEMEAAQLPRTLADVDMAVVNGNYALEAGLSIADALATEAVESESAQTYANIVVVKEGNEENAAVKALCEALQSEQVKSFIEEKYEGAVVALF